MSHDSKITQNQTVNLSAQMIDFLPVGVMNLLTDLSKVAENEGCILYLVGGFVRDLILDSYHAGIDFDFVLEGNAIGFAKVLSQVFGGELTYHHRFKTVKWKIDKIYHRWLTNKEAYFPKTIDITTARREIYRSPGALPDIIPSNIEDDVNRRDFTINTLALRIDKSNFGDILDIFGGLEDINNRIIRVLHRNSYRDDPTRIFRAVRYEQRYNFKIDVLDLKLIEDSRSIIEKISGERIRNELNHIFSETQSEKILSRLEKFGILKSISENFYWDDWLSDQWDIVKRFPSIIDWKLEITEKQKIDLFYILWFSHLFHRSQEITEIIMNRIKLSNKLKDSIRSVEMLRNILITMISDPPSKITSYLEKFDMPSLYITYLTFDNEKVKDIIYNYVSRWRHISSNITGEDLKKRGITPGVIYKQILGHLRNAWLDGTIKTKKEELLLLDGLATAFTPSKCSCLMSNHIESK